MLFDSFCSTFEALRSSGGFGTRDHLKERTREKLETKPHRTEGFRPWQYLTRLTSASVGPRLSSAGAGAPLSWLVHRAEDCCVVDGEHRRARIVSAHAPRREARHLLPPPRRRSGTARA